MQFIVGGVPVTRGVRGQKWENEVVPEVDTVLDGWVQVFYSNPSP